MHIHLDPVGGVAGDMFAAALLDAFPALESVVQSAVRAAGLPARFQCDLVPHADHALVGKRFLVLETKPGNSAHHHPHHPHSPHGDHGHAHESTSAHAHASTRSHSDGHAHGHSHDDAHEHNREHHHEHAHDPEHGHKPFAAIRAALLASPLSPGVRDRTIAIFSALAEAEAQVHGMTVDTVTFHEVGEWDSIADIVAAAAIIDALSSATWTVGPLPLGSGFVKSAHGLLPVPAPATTLLLRGLSVRDDGIGGERVTPTGAAIVRYLLSLPGHAPRERTLLGTGLGFGLRTLPGLSNCVRAIVFEGTTTGSAKMAPGVSAERITGIEFEVDDQTPEDLAIGLDHIRSHDRVLDVLQMPALGKKGRVVISVRVLCETGAEDDVADLCFQETTTLGLRLLDIRRRTLARARGTTSVEGRSVELKTADRPGVGATAKVEAESLRSVRGHEARQSIRKSAARD